MLDLFNVLEEIKYCNDTFGNGVFIPAVIGNIIHYVYLAIQIVVPIMLIIFGMIDLAKALSASKEDEIKKAQSGLLKKAIVAILVFLVFSLVRFVFNFASGDLGEDGRKTVWNCVDELINGKNNSK